MEYDELMASCPMGRAFLREEAAARAGGRGLDMTALWKESGRPRGRSPRHWLAGRFERERVHDEGGGPDGRILADPGVALLYAALWLDGTGTLGEVLTGIFWGTLRADPAPMLTKENAGLMALTAKLDLVAQGLTDAEAGRHLIEGVKRHVAAQGLDVYAEETKVMHAQRAVADFDATGLVYDRDGNPIS